MVTGQDPPSNGGINECWWIVHCSLYIEEHLVSTPGGLEIKSKFHIVRDDSLFRPHNSSYFGFDT